MRVFKNPVVIALGMWICLTAVGFIVFAGFQGCGTLAPGTAEHPSPYGGVDATGAMKTPDRILYDADLAIATAYDALHGFVTFELQNRAALASTPAIKQAADKIRAGAPKWFASAIAVRDAYAGNPSTENRTALQRALDILQQAISEANRYRAVQPLPQ